MSHLLSACRKFFKSEDGPTSVEYAVMLAMIITVCIVSVRTMGTNTNASFQKMSTQLQTANS